MKWGGRKRMMKNDEKKSINKRKKGFFSVKHKMLIEVSSFIKTEKLIVQLAEVFGIQLLS